MTIANHEQDLKALQKRTLTNLYNAKPAWLSMAHLQLDRAARVGLCERGTAEGGQGGKGQHFTAEHHVGGLLLR